MSKMAWRGTLNDRYARIIQAGADEWPQREHDRWWLEQERSDRLKRRARRIKELTQQATRFRENLRADNPYGGRPLHTRLLDPNTPPFTLTWTIDPE